MSSAERKKEEIIHKSSLPFWLIFQDKTNIQAKIFKFMSHVSEKTVIVSTFENAENKTKKQKTIL
jgi:hypothetical protein